MTESETIVVVGAGVIGLSIALNIQQYLSPSQSVLIVARDLPSDTSVNYASPWAGAHYRPVPGSSPQALREAGQALRTYEFMKRVAVDEPASGVQFIKGIEYLEAPPPEYLDEQSVRNSYSHLDGLRYLSAKERPAGVVWGVEYDTYVVNSPVYCAYMLRKFILKGGSMRKYTLASLKEAFSLASNVRTVVNSSGTGFGDPESFIIRGQTCLVRNLSSATITRQNSDGSWSFCIPRPLDGGTIIGGTKQPHNWDPHPSPEIRATLLANAAKWFPFTPESEGKFDVIHDIVGRRPAREGGMRLEVEKVGSEQFIVHAYGAGGRGFEISRGVAEDTTALMLDHGFLHPKAAL
ncbi:D-amino-acid oxidase [Penicillium chermesinum]|nr:D-amino-acid oxidase [Penicillium chermesinum]